MELPGQTDGEHDVAIDDFPADPVERLSHAKSVDR
jgi:hypothetical protein